MSILLYIFQLLLQNQFQSDNIKRILYIVFEIKFRTLTLMYSYLNLIMFL